MNTILSMQALSGLSENEVLERRKSEGANELPTSKPRNFFLIAWDVVREPMFLLLVSCGVLYLLLGDRNEALMLLGFVFVVMGITLFQERKTERALEKLRDLSSPRALVIRGGEQKRIAGRDVVREDIFIVSEGDRIPADGVIVGTSSLAVDESLLTGESIAAMKDAWDGKSSLVPLSDNDHSLVYSGTLVVRGKAYCRALAVGGQTQIGKIGASLERLQPEETFVQKETLRLVRVFFIFGVGVSFLVFLLYSLTHGDWLKGLLAGLSLAMAVLPEEFPVILSIFFALGAWRIAKKGVLTRRVPVVEMLGAATVLCSDKTGTITFNQMTVRQIVLENGEHIVCDDSFDALPETFHKILEFGILASQRDPFDPMEKAFHKLGERYLKGTEHLHDEWSCVREYPLSSQMPAMTEVWESISQKHYVIAAKGAPEAIIDLCHLSPERATHILDQVHTLAQEGLRVLAVAASEMDLLPLPGIQHDFSYAFLGLIALEDPVRPSVSQSIQECRGAGIRVVMITGDHPSTAETVARKIGIFQSNALLTGTELDALDDAALRKRIGSVTVFARISPEQKLRIVEALKANGEIVAMTGDGVNDAPALKAAHIGIAMGTRGTDTAREASALVLVDDDFSSIVSAIHTGRRIFDNLRKAMSYTVAVHIPIAGLSLIPVLMRWPLILFPVHIVLLELIIDPACSIAFEMEEEEPDIMQRPPRNPRAPLFGKGRMTLSILQGCGVLLVMVFLYYFSLRSGMADAEARTLVFVSLIVANLSLILTNRSWTKTVMGHLKSVNAAVIWIIVGAAALLTMGLTIPVVRGVFLFSPLSWQDLVLSIVMGCLSVLWFELLKFFRSDDLARA